MEAPASYTLWTASGSIRFNVGEMVWFLTPSFEWQLAYVDHQRPSDVIDHLVALRIPLCDPHTAFASTSVDPNDVATATERFHSSPPLP